MFDPPSHPEMTSVDVIGSHLFWAAGYNVPANTIAYLDPAALAYDPKATYTDRNGRKEKMSKAYMDLILTRLRPAANGLYRCVASRYLPGKPLGPFEYEGRRGDDPEDLIPHELRRELRGLWTVAAWISPLFPEA